MEGMKRSVARGRNPFGAGTVFQCRYLPYPETRTSRNPFGAGAVFQYASALYRGHFEESQSLWSRDGFSMIGEETVHGDFAESQSLWSRDGFSIT